MQPVTTTLSVPRPFSLKATVLSHGWHECCPMSWCEGGQCFQIIERDGNDAYRISVVEKSRTIRKVTMRVTIEGKSVRAEFVDDVLGRLGVSLGLDRDITPFHDICRNDPLLHVIPKLEAGRGIRSASMTENIIKAICGTNVTWNQAVKMINRLGQLGPVVPHFVNLNAWPTPREILKAGKRYLEDVCRVGYRADSILTFCEQVTNGDINPESWDTLANDESVSTDELLRLLKSVRGIGPSSANYLVSFLGRHAHLSIDTATVAHVARTHTNGRKPTNQKIEQIYAKYGDWRQSAWWYEHWLNWDTCKQMMRDAGISSDAPKTRTPRKRSV